MVLNNFYIILQTKEMFLNGCDFYGRLWEVEHPRDGREWMRRRDQGSSLKSKTLQLRDDKEFVMRFLDRCGADLAHASDRLKGDKEVVFLAIRQNYQSMVHASGALRADPEFALRCLRRKQRSFNYLASSLQNDRQFVLEAIEKSGLTLYYVSREFKDCDEVVLASIRHNSGYDIKYASERLRSSRDFIEKVLEIKKDQEGYGRWLEKELTKPGFHRISKSNLLHARRDPKKVAGCKD